ncbi:hypothetical protein BDF14DRAFT_1003205 [Spinellus fusiger]|nr:hypothetical protein BDF14DRAFT_1003205 [Spinellus fusiger]
MIYLSKLDHPSGIIHLKRVLYLNKYYYQQETLLWKMILYMNRIYYPSGVFPQRKAYYLKASKATTKEDTLTEERLLPEMSTSHYIENLIGSTMTCSNTLSDRKVLTSNEKETYVNLEDSVKELAHEKSNTFKVFTNTTDTDTDTNKKENDSISSKESKGSSITTVKLSALKNESESTAYTVLSKEGKSYNTGLEITKDTFKETLQQTSITSEANDISQTSDLLPSNIPQDSISEQKNISKVESNVLDTSVTQHLKTVHGYVSEETHFPIKAVPEDMNAKTSSRDASESDNPQSKSIDDLKQKDLSENIIHSDHQQKKDQIIITSKTSPTFSGVEGAIGVSRTTGAEAIAVATTIATTATTATANKLMIKDGVSIKPDSPPPQQVSIKDFITQDTYPISNELQKTYKESEHQLSSISQNNTLTTSTESVISHEKNESHKDSSLEKGKGRVSSTSSEEMRRLSGSQRSHWSAGRNLWDTAIKSESPRIETASRQSTANASEAGSEQWFDSNEEWLLEQAERRKSRMKSPVMEESSLSSSDEEDNVWHSELALHAVAVEKSAKGIHYLPKKTSPAPINDERASYDDTLGSQVSNSSFLELHSIRRTSEDTIRQLPAIAPVAYESIVTAANKERFSSSDDASFPSRDPSSSFSSPRRSTGDSLSTSPPHSPQKTREEEQVQFEASHNDFGNIAVATTSRLVAVLPQSEGLGHTSNGSTKIEIDRQESMLMQERKVLNVHDTRVAEIPHAQDLQVTASEPIFSTDGLSPTQQGKLYIRVNGAHSILLPLPKEVTYVRCVVSDGRYEYMSRYEILGQQVLLDYECIVDTHPDMIVTVALHVRPDYHVKPRTGLSRWFTSIRKQKESLSGYVHPDDGAIGQTRFALPHMMHACYQKTYRSTFDCFNSWYCRSARERQRRQQLGEEEDVLKVIGNLSIEMLYLPVSNPSLHLLA